MSHAKVLLTLFLAGCATTNQMQADVSARWIGQPIDAFIVRHGVPQVSQRLNDGRMVAEWTDVYGVADTGAPIQAIIGVAGNAQVQGGSYQLICSLRLISRGGTIEQVHVVADTVGRWNTSRCAEVLR